MDNLESEIYRIIARLCRDVHTLQGYIKKIDKYIEIREVEQGLGEIRYMLDKGLKEKRPDL